VTADTPDWHGADPRDTRPHSPKTPAPSSPKESKDEEKWVHDYLSGTRLPLAHDRELHALIAALRERVAEAERGVAAVEGVAAAFESLPKANYPLGWVAKRIREALADGKGGTE
jgi:hypothetical protein